MRLDEAEGEARQAAAAERILSGFGVSPGIAIGPAHVAEGGPLPIRERHLPEAEIEAERRRFAEAVAVSLKQLRKLKAKSSVLPESAAEEVGYLLDAHLAMLSNSRLVRGAGAGVAATLAHRPASLNSCEATLMYLRPASCAPLTLRCRPSFCRC